MKKSAVGIVGAQAGTLPAIVGDTCQVVGIVLVRSFGLGRKCLWYLLRSEFADWRRGWNWCN